MPRVREARRFVRVKNLRRRPGSQNETAIRCRSILFLRDCHADMWARTWVGADTAQIPSVRSLRAWPPHERSFWRDRSRSSRLRPCSNWEQAGSWSVTIHSLPAERTARRTGALRHAVPAIFQYREFAAAGGLMSYGGNLTDNYRLTGVYVGGYSRARSPPTCRSCSPRKSS
jgi:hypothetical protein